jgi:hypothetical protein
MIAINENKLAFPQPITASPNGRGGVPLRDYLAAKAMPALIADYCEFARKAGFDEQWQMAIATDVKGEHHAKAT